MRITNRIMQNNSLFNINGNKVNEDRLSTQLATGKSITRPSDDPVVAIRALRLRTNVSTVTQFYKKNAPDADLWLTTTEDALGTLNDVLTDMVKQANSGANDYKGVADLKIIMEQLNQLAEEVYATGDTDYAGRYIFTGYRTDTPLTFQDDKNPINNDPTYTITEQFTREDMDQQTYVETLNLFNMNESTYNQKTEQTGKPVTETDVTSTGIYRIRLSYDNLDVEDEAGAQYIPSLTQGTKDSDGNYTANRTYQSPRIYETAEEAMRAIASKDMINQQLNAVSNELTDAQTALTDRQTELTDAETALSNAETVLTDAETALAADPGNTALEAARNAAQAARDTAQTARNAAQAKVDGAQTKVNELQTKVNELNADRGATVAYCAKTGELFLSDAVYDELNASTDEIRVEYKKSTFAGSDFRPEHYYACTAQLRTPTGGLGETIDYNPEYLTKGRDNARQEITYDVGANQRIRINTTADEVFNPGIRRDIADLNKRLTSLEEIETTRDKLKAALEAATTEDEKADIQLRLDAAEKARTYLVDDMNKMFGQAMTKFQGYLDDTSVAITSNGSRSMRLQLISTRLGSQKLTYEDLQSQNEDVDIAEAMVQIQSAELTYNASLMATGKILQTSLLNYL